MLDSKIIYVIRDRNGILGKFKHNNIWKYNNGGVWLLKNIEDENVYEVIDENKLNNNMTFNCVKWENDKPIKFYEQKINDKIKYIKAEPIEMKQIVYIVRDITGYLWEFDFIDTIRYTDKHDCVIKQEYIDFIDYKVIKNKNISSLQTIKWQDKLPTKCYKILKPNTGWEYDIIRDKK